MAGKLPGFVAWSDRQTDFILIQYRCGILCHYFYGKWFLLFKSFKRIVGVLFVWQSYCYLSFFWKIGFVFVWLLLRRAVEVCLKRMCSNRGGSRGGAIGAIVPLKTYESYFIHHDFYNSKNIIHDIRPFCRPLLCHSSIVKYASSLLQ